MRALSSPGMPPITRPAAGLALALLLLALLAGCTTAPGRLAIHDETEALNRAQLEAAAAPLVARGVVLGVFLAARGDDTGADMQRRLGAAGLLAGEAIAPEAIAIYVSLTPRYSELRAGRRWSAALPDAALREIRLGALNPALRDGSPSEGVAATLGALEQRLASPPLGARLGPWLSTFAVACGIALAIWISPLGEPLGKLWRRSPPRRLAQWLWDQTPSGRQSLERALRITRQRLDDRVEYARAAYKGAREPAGLAPGETLPARLKGLDRERETLLQTRRGRALLDEMDRLAWAYQALGRDAEGLHPPKPPAKRRKGKASGGAYLVAGSSDSTASSSTSGSDSSSWDYGSSSDAGGPSSDGGSW